MSGVLVLNADYGVLTSVSWQRAVTMLVTGEAEIHEADPERQVRSPSCVVEFPRVIRLLRWVYVKFTEKGLLDVGNLATKRGVLDRDKRTCVYCGKPGDTIDHVMPKSRGGKDTWENMACACRSCNHRKADRTPEEAGMRLRWHPWRPDKTGYTQRRIWQSLEPVAY